MSKDLVLQFLADKSPRTCTELEECVAHGGYKARALVKQGWVLCVSYGVYAISERGLEAVASLQRNASHDTTPNDQGSAEPSLPRGAAPMARAIEAPTRRRQVLAEAPRNGVPTTRDGASPATTTGHPQRWSA